LTWYFAYGRNVSIDVFVKRVGVHPVFVHRGILPGYELRFNKSPGPKRGAGYANVVPAAGRWVEGVLYRVVESDLERLDSYEGVPHHYRRSRVKVWNVDQRRWVDAVMYVAVKTDDLLRPPREYLEGIIDSAKSVGLSPEWVSKLERLLERAV